MTELTGIRGRIKIKLGKKSFSAEGDQEWLDKQVSKFLDVTASGNIVETTTTNLPEPESAREIAAFKETLPTFLRSKSATTIQNKRFLATAGWLHRRGNKLLKTTDITKALRDSQQAKLGNASECLNQNIKKGFCEKSSDGSFFVTPDGWRDLGEQP